MTASSNRFPDSDNDANNNKAKLTTAIIEDLKPNIITYRYIRNITVKARSIYISFHDYAKRDLLKNKLLLLFEQIQCPLKIEQETKKTLIIKNFAISIEEDKFREILWEVVNIDLVTKVNKQGENLEQIFKKYKLTILSLTFPLRSSNSSNLTTQTPIHTKTTSKPRRSHNKWLNSSIKAADLSITTATITNQFQSSTSQTLVFLSQLPAAQPTPEIEVNNNIGETSLPPVPKRTKVETLPSHHNSNTGLFPSNARRSPTLEDLNSWCEQVSSFEQRIDFIP